jgi:hypothetical protein
MPSPGEYKTVQARILAYAQAISWTYVPLGEAEKRRGFDHSKATPAEEAAEASPYGDDLLDTRVRKLNPGVVHGNILEKPGMAPTSSQSETGRIFFSCGRRLQIRCVPFSTPS